MSSSFSQNIRLLRQERQLTQVTAASELGISQALLSHYENDMREPGLAFIHRVCDYYGVTADFLLGRTGVRELASGDSAVSGEGADDMKPNPASQRICEAVTILFDLLGQLPEKDASEAAERYLGSAIYRLYRVLSNCAPDSSKVLRESENSDFTHSASNADMQMSEIEYTNALSALAGSRELFPESGYAALKDAYPAQYQALFQVVYDSVQRISAMVSAREDPDTKNQESRPVLDL